MQLDRAREETGPEDVGQQVLMRGFHMSVCTSWAASVWVRASALATGHTTYPRAPQPWSRPLRCTMLLMGAPTLRPGSPVRVHSSRSVLAGRSLRLRPMQTSSRRAQRPSRMARQRHPKGLSLTAVSTAARWGSVGVSALPHALTAPPGTPPEIPLGATVRQMSQMKPAISRATAVTATVGILPFLISPR